jgi:hypothetical protein
MPESFQHGRELLEVATNDSSPAPERGEVGPTLLHRVGVAIDPDELCPGGGVEERPRMSGATQRGVDDDASVSERGLEELDDSVA